MADVVRPLRDVLLEKGQQLFSGRIDVDTGGIAGVLHMSEGLLLEARLGTAVGEPALWRLLLHQSPRITVEPGRPRATSGAVLGKPDALLPRFDERFALLERYAEKVGGFDRVWAIRFEALAQVLDDLPDAINPVLRLLDGRRTVRQVVTESALDDVLALRILGKLLALGVLILPDDSLLPGPAADVIDVDEGLEAALAASLAEIEAEEAAAAARSEADPIPLVPRAQTQPPAPSPAPPAAPAPTAPPTTATPATATQTTEPPVTAMPSPAPAPSPTPTPEPEAPRKVTMMPRDVSIPPDVTLPVVTAQPTAPPTRADDLKAWLGAEEAFFSADARPTSTTGDLVAPASRPALGYVPMIALFAGALLIGMLIASRGC